MGVLLTNALWNDEPIQWFLAAQAGPTGRMAQLEVNPARLVAVTRTNDETGAEETVTEEEGFYQRRIAVTLFKGGKQTARFNNLDSYDARRLAESWVDQGE